MNGYNLIRDWYNFKFENPSKARAIHSDFFCYLVDQWNRLGQKKEFGLPTSVTMESLGIGSYNTYKKTLLDLVSFGFVKIVKDSQNQHQSKIVALSKNDKPTDKALDKATIKASDKPTDTITKQINKETINIRKLKFSETLNPFLGKYGKDLLNEFYLYWTEPNKSNTKLKFELQKTWSLERRLMTWKKNNDKFYPNLQNNEQRKQQLGEITAELRRYDPTL